MLSGLVLLAACSEQGGRSSDAARIGTSRLVVVDGGRAAPRSSIVTIAPVPAATPSPEVRSMPASVTFPSAGDGLAQPSIVPGAPARPLPEELAPLAAATTPNN